VAGFKYPSPILAVSVVGAGMSREDRHLAVGMQSGLLSIRTRLSGQLKVQARERQKEMKALEEGRIEDYDKKKSKRTQGDKKRLRGRDFTGEGADIVIEGNARGKIRNQSKWETALRKGQYAHSLDLVLNAPHFDPQNMLTLIAALRHRSALRAALKDRDEAELQPILRWLVKRINDPRCIKATSEVALNVLDLYAGQMGDSPEVDNLMGQLHRRVRHCADLAQQARSTQGMLDLLAAGS